MKKRLSLLSRGVLFVLLFTLLFNTALFSRIVGREEAGRAALHWLHIENSLHHLRLTDHTYDLKKITDLIYRNEVIGYVFHLSPSGFMIVPNITELSPIKYISYDADFEDVKEHSLLVLVFEQFLHTKISLNYIPDTQNIYRKEKYEMPDYIQLYQNQRLWEELLYEYPRAYSLQTGEEVRPMLKSKWSQGYPYNMYTPEIGGQQTWTGCAATAMAQIMYYWKYPVIGEGSHSYLWRWDRELSADFDREYFWNRMVDSYSGSETFNQKDAVARLMSDVGISINMSYGLDSSIAVPNANDSFSKFFKYSPFSNSAFFRYRKHHYDNWTDWFHEFKHQMDDGKPAILVIFKNDEDGHVVVIDGYLTHAGNQVHVNMGWGGAHDAYYTIDNIYGYTSENQYAVVDILPDIYWIGLRIIEHPKDQVIRYGQSARLSVSTESNDRFQWYQGSSGDVSNPIPGATSRVFTTPPLVNTTSYWVRVFYWAWSHRYIDSNTATITVQIVPAIAAHPQSRTIQKNQTVNLKVNATGTEPLSYQWYQGNSGDTGSPIDGANSSSYTTPVLSNTTSYWVRVSNDVGYADSRTATITAKCPPEVVEHPKTQSIPYGQKATLAVTAIGTDPLSYQWYQGNSGDTGNPIAGATSSSYTTQVFEGGINYWVRILNDYGHADSRTATIFFPVHPPADFKLQRLENNYIFFKEYVNRLSWRRNPENRTKIVMFKLFGKPKDSDDSAYRWIADLDAGVFNYEQRGLKIDDLYAYRIISVNDEGRESDPTEVSN